MVLLLGLLCVFGSVDVVLAKNEVVVFVVDPSWDCVATQVAHVPLLKEYKVVKVMTHRGKLTPCTSDYPAYADIYRNITYNSLTPNDVLAAEEICPKLRAMGIPIAAVIPTFEPAVALTDRLAACVEQRGNPFEGPLANARRDKWAMGEAVRKAGLRSAKEKFVTTWDEAKEYLESLSPPLSHEHPVMFKITGGAGSMGVTKVYSVKQGEQVFSRDVGSKTFGVKNRGVLIMEFLQGKEYVIDSVSRDGIHKVVMVWDEDLRPANGVFDLYFGFKVMDPKDEKIKAIIDYSNKVLDATGLRNGAADMEVMWLEEEGQPCLVEINARWTALSWHDGLNLEMATVGNNQITATINAYLDGDAFNELPPVPVIQQFGAIVFTITYQTGILRGMPGLAIAKKLPSYFDSRDKSAFVGKRIEKDTGATPLYILLAHKDEAVVDADYDRLVALENSNSFFDITPSTGFTSLTAFSASAGGLPGYQLPAIAVLAIVAVAVAVALAAMARRNVRDGYDYLIIE